MSFNDEQKAALAAPLDRGKVKSRSQGGQTLSYIEAWHAIAEANRVFGFDGWTRELISLAQVADAYQTNGKWRVGYRATVRIMAGDIIRDGTGYGSGINNDLNDAHESAVKEAESDAMKRALMTFGNPFGLALYDKTQANVEDAPRQQRAPERPRPEAVRTPPRDAEPPADILAEMETIATQFPGMSESLHKLIQQLRQCQTTTAYKSWEDKNLSVIGKLETEEVNALRAECGAQKERIRKMNQLAA